MMKKKKILILTSFGGGGNFVASQAMKTYLDSDYDVQLCHAFKEILAPIDPFNTLTFNSYSGEQFYNAFVPGKHFELLAWVYKFGTWYMQSQKEKVHALLRDYFIKTQPDLIISVIPVINNIILDVAQKLYIPFLLAPTDLDITPYIMGIKNPTYKKFYLSLMFRDADMAKIVQDANIPQQFWHIIGAPLRKDFLIPKNKSDILKKIFEKEKIVLREDIPVVMLLMGSLGSDEIKNYAMRLLTVQKPFQLLILIGRNEESKKELARLTIPGHISTSVIGFTEEVANFMAVSDLLITKSGTMSVCEALYANLPLFLDATSTLLPWEKFNHTFIKQHVFGMSITKYDDVAPLVNNVLEHNDELILYKNNIEKLEKKDFSIEFKKLVDKILQ